MFSYIFDICTDCNMFCIISLHFAVVLPLLEVLIFSFIFSSIFIVFVVTRVSKPPWASLGNGNRGKY